MRITVRDIAKQAGVSPASVSLVLNNKKGISEQTRKRVQDILDENNYVKRAVNRKEKYFHLKIIKYRAHGMALEENQGFVASIIDEIERECRRLSMSLSTRNCEAQQMASFIDDINNEPLDGIILLGTELVKADYWLLERFKVPLVVLDNSMQNEKWDSVVMDNESIMMAAVEHLYELGHREIGYFKGNRQISNLDERYDGYLHALRQLGLAVPEPTMLTMTLNGAYQDMLAMILDGDYVPHGAAVADNDSIAIGATKAIQEAHFNIPGDISIVGVDDIPYSAVTTPALSTVRISRLALGSLAVDMILKRIQKPDLPTMRLKIAGNFIERDSTREVLIVEEE